MLILCRVFHFPKLYSDKNYYGTSNHSVYQRPFGTRVALLFEREKRDDVRHKNVRHQVGIPRKRIYNEMRIKIL